MNIFQRAAAPTPKFFKVLRNIGLIMLAISGAVMTSPISLPAAVITISGYVAVAGGIISAVSQVTVSDKGRFSEVNEASEDRSINRHGYDPDIYRE